MSEPYLSPDLQPNKKKTKGITGPKPLGYENLDEKSRFIKLVKQARNKRNRKRRPKGEEFISSLAPIILTDNIERSIGFSNDISAVLSSANISNSSNTLNSSPGKILIDNLLALFNITFILALEQIYQSVGILFPGIDLGTGVVSTVIELVAQEWYYYQFSVKPKASISPSYYVLTWKTFIQTGLRLKLIDVYLTGWCLLDAVLNAIFADLGRKVLSLLRAKLAKTLLEFLDHCELHGRWAFDSFEHFPIPLDSDQHTKISCCAIPLSASEFFTEWGDSLTSQLVSQLRKWLSQSTKEIVSLNLWPLEINEFLLICEVICKRNIILIQEYNGSNASELVSVDVIRYADWETTYVFWSPDHCVAGVELL